jgi:pimeloyl-ACP methyl ester carboxylesterase
MSGVLVMPYATNDRVRIYYEHIGSGPPLLLHHGSIGSGEDWRDFGYVDALSPDHQVILMDARGHGRSDKPHEPAAYDLKLRAMDVAAVLDDLGLQAANYFGYSMGGWIGFGLAKYAPERASSLILGGAHPYPEDMTAFRNLIPQQPQAFVELIEPVFGQYLTPGMRQRCLMNDLVALRALTQDRSSLADALPNISMPSMIFVGEADPRFPLVKRCSEQLPNTAFFSLPGCDHVSACARSELVLPHIRGFLAGLARYGRS